jgi:hypothetical protein
MWAPGDLASAAELTSHDSLGKVTGARTLSREAWVRGPRNAASPRLGQPVKPGGIPGEGWVKLQVKGLTAPRLRCPSSDLKSL